MIFFLNVICL